MTPDQLVQRIQYLINMIQLINHKLQNDEIVPLDALQKELDKLANTIMENEKSCTVIVKNLMSELDRGLRALYETIRLQHHALEQQMESMKNRNDAIKTYVNMSQSMGGM